MKGMMTKVEHFELLLPLCDEISEHEAAYLLAAVRLAEEHTKNREESRSESEQSENALLEFIAVRSRMEGKDGC